jgi:hypothetical protein
MLSHMPPTNDDLQVIIHLLHLGLHLRAAHTMCVACMVYPKVVCDQHIPLLWLLQQWHQMLR